MIRLKTLILEASDIRKIIGIKEAIKGVEFAFRRLGEARAQMPPKIYLHLDKYKGDFRAMPAYIDDLRACGIKWVNVHPGNKKKGLPTVMAVIILSDSASGFPLSVMDGTYITALRTGAAGGVAAKYLAGKNSRKIALVGCGVQAKAQLLALTELFNLEQVNVWGSTLKQARRFIREMRGLRGLRFFALDTVKDCVSDSDIIVTATPSRRPLVKSEWIKNGAHINAIGADAKGKQELDYHLLKRAKIVVDSWEQAAHSGEINVPLSKGQLSKKDIYGDIGEVVTGKKRREKEEEVTVFDSTGLAIQDIALANLVYKKAIRLGKGKFVNLIV